MDAVANPEKKRCRSNRLLPELDGRSTWARRAKELLANFVNGQLGGEGNCSEAEFALVKRAVVLMVELERREVEFAKVGAVDDTALLIYQTTVNTLRRTLESIGLQRRAKSVPDLDAYLRAKAKAKAKAGVEVEAEPVV